jgi:hypothetical protein
MRIQKNRLNISNQKSQKLASQFLQHRKNNCDHYGVKVKKWVIFKTFFGFPFLDIFKNVRISFPFLLFGKKL